MLVSIDVKSSQLNWSKLSWTQFQRLVIHFAENLIPETYFAEYLKQGHKQEGIDLKEQFLKKDGSFITIQCKHVPGKQKISQLETIISEFLVHTFSETSTRFILATTADLQNPEIQDWIRIKQDQTRKDYNIELDFWDLGFIEEHLKKMWSIVAYYFGERSADDFCFRQLNTTQFPALSNNPVAIPRKISASSNGDPSETLIWQLKSKQLIYLKDLFIKDRLTTHRVCLIGEAYQGKSTYLKQTAFELKESGLRIQPLLIEIKDHNVQPIEKILEQNYGSWRNIPFKDIIIFIDGLDEVPTSEFEKVTKHIKEFSLTYPAVNLVTSCRTLFFHLYNVKESIRNFQTYELYNLQSDDVDDFIAKRLEESASEFKEGVHRSNLTHLLYHPFYLVNLVEEYLKPPHRLPSSKLDVLRSFVDRAAERARLRRLSGGRYVSHEPHHFRKVVQKFAFCLQLIGKNTLEQDEIEQIFNQDERELLQHNSLISIRMETWGFTNALFQEHLAASQMIEMSYEKIISLISVGKVVRKIKTKWIQTLSSLLSLLEPQTPLFQKLLSFIENDSIELIFQTEKTKFPDDFRVKALQKLIMYCNEQDIRPMMLYENTIASFIEGANLAVLFLMDCLGKQDFSVTAKIVCSRILQNITIPTQIEENLLNLLVAEIKASESDYYASELVRVLAAHKLGNSNTVEQLTRLFPNRHTFRDKIYEWIVSLDLVEDFWAYGLEGAGPLIEFNKKITHAGSEARFEAFFLAFKHRWQLHSLLNHLSSDDWLQFYRYKSFKSEGFFHRLFTKCCSFFERDPLIILPIARFIKKIGSHYMREQFIEIDEFLDKTKSHPLVVRLLIDDIFLDAGWELGALITPPSFDYFIFEFEQGQYPAKILRAPIVALSHFKKSEIEKDFSSLCKDATENTVFDITDLLEYQKMQKLEQDKIANDLELIQSLPSFITALTDFFRAYGKTSLTQDDIFIDLNRSNAKKATLSHFVFKYLYHWRMKLGVAELKDCIEFISRDRNFDVFRAEEILQYPYHGGNIDEVLLPILQQFYNESLPQCNFENSYWIKDNQYWQKNREDLVGRIFDKFDFTTPDQYLLQFIWLDRSGIRGLRENHFERNKTIFQKLYEKLSEPSRIKVKSRVLQNLSQGILLESVLGTHLAVCEWLEIREAREFIWCILISDSYTELYKDDICDIYLKLGGEKQELTTLFERITDYNDYFFTYLLRILKDVEPDLVNRSGELAINAVATSEEQRVSIAQILVQIGNMNAYLFLAELIRSKKQAPYHVQSGFTVERIDTSCGLTAIADLMYLFIDPRYECERQVDSAKSILAEWLFAFAAKSENDLGLVLDFIEMQEKALAVKYSNAKDLFWYYNRILENFRDSDNNIKSIKEINFILKDLQV